MKFKDLIEAIQPILIGSLIGLIVFWSYHFFFESPVPFEKDISEQKKLEIKHEKNLGLEFAEFEILYANVAKRYNASAFTLGNELFHSTLDDETFYFFDNGVAIIVKEDLEIDKILQIAVGVNYKKAYNLKVAIQTAGVIFCFIAKVFSPELSEKECTSIAQTLLKNSEYHNEIKGRFQYQSRISDDFLFLIVKNVD